MKTLLVWAPHTSKAGLAVAMPAIAWDDYQPTDDHLEIEATHEELTRHEKMKTVFGWRVASLIEDALGLSDREFSDELDAMMEERSELFRRLAD